jgi:hypothetical protein
MKIMTFPWMGCLVLACTPTWANDNLAPEAAPQVHWGMSLGMNHYAESKMQLGGPEIGAHARLTGLDMLPNWQLEGDVLLGQQKYTSTGTGNMEGVRNIETRWRALVPVYNTGVGQEGLSTGLGLHTLWNNLSGTSTTGHAGYVRQATQIWWPVRWTSNGDWQLEGGLLLRGVHTSRLSQINSGYADIRNTQKSGAYLQTSTSILLEDGTYWSPFVRLTRLGDSDIVRSNHQAWVEPRSQRWQIGAMLNF